ncbi:MAG: glycosyltransferase [Endomicrobiia bacterium]
MTNKPLISIIIPVFNVEKTIEKCLQSIFELNYPNYEVIIINDGSTDNTGKILVKYSDKLKILETLGIGPSAARNIALKEAKGEYIALTDGDCIVDKEWLNKLLEGFLVDKKIVGVGGTQVSPEDETEFGKMITNFMKSVGFIDYIKTKTAKGYFTSHNPSCNVMYKKEIFDKVGNFKEGLWPGEDVEFDYRITKIGYKLFFNPEAVVYHYRAENILKFIKMMFNYGKAQGILVRMYGFFRKLHFVPIIFFPLIIFFIWTMTISLEFGFSKFLLVLNVIFLYAIFRTNNFIEWLRFIVLFIITIFVWNIGFLHGVLFKK